MIRRRELRSGKVLLAATAVGCLLKASVKAATETAHAFSAEESVHCGPCCSACISRWVLADWQAITAHHGTRSKVCAKAPIGLS